MAEPLNLTDLYMIVLCIKNPSERRRDTRNFRLMMHLRCIDYQVPNITQSLSKYPHLRAAHFFIGDPSVSFTSLTHLDHHKPPPPANMTARALTALFISLLPGAALAKTDLDGCTWIEGTYTPTWDGPDPWRTRFYYDPDTFEECSFLDCGGGRAPPKKNVPGCGEYTGTASYSPMYLDIVTLTGETTPTATEGILRTGPPPGLSVMPTTATSTTIVSTETESAGGSTEGGSAEESTDGTTDGGEGEATMTTESRPSTPTGAAAAPTVGAVLGGCLVAGAGVMGML